MKTYIITYRNNGSENDHTINCNSYAEAVCVAQTFLRDDSVVFVQIDVCETLKDSESEA